MFRHRGHAERLCEGDGLTCVYIMLSNGSWVYLLLVPCREGGATNWETMCTHAVLLI